MHANRLFLLGPAGADRAPQIAECVSAARVVFETVDGLAREGPLFHSFWWTHYVTFCALLVTYVWEIRQERKGEGKGEGDARVLELAERCQMHLANATASNSPSRRYAVILEEFRREASGRAERQVSPEMVDQDSSRPLVSQMDAPSINDWGVAPVATVDGMDYAAGYDTQVEDHMPSLQLGPAFLDEWQTTDWLDLDSSVSMPLPRYLRHDRSNQIQAFGPYMGMDMSSMQWMPNGNFGL